MSYLEWLSFNYPLSLKNTIVVHGCRYEQKDFVSKNILKEFELKGVVVKVIFSREGEEGNKYVHHILEKDSDKLFKSFIDNNLYNMEVYVCGGSKFLPDEIYRLNNKGTNINIIKFDTGSKYSKITS